MFDRWHKLVKSFFNEKKGQVGTRSMVSEGLAL